MNKALDAKERLTSYANKVQPILEQYFDNELSQVPESRDDIFHTTLKHIKEHCLRHSKRLRGSLVVCGYELFGGQDMEEILRVSIANEITHTALLIHDDIIDQDNIRRGGQSSHKYFQGLSSSKDNEHFGRSLAICAGDIALLTGPKIILDSKFQTDLKLNAAKILLQGLISTGYGEIFDVYMEDRKILSQEDVYFLHQYKTGIYTYQTPLLVGAALAQEGNDKHKQFEEYCYKAGIAFQLQDDILGVFGDSSKTGKSSDSDIKEGKITLLYLKTIENLMDNSPKEMERLKSLWGQRDITTSEVEWIKGTILKSGAYDHSITTSKDLAKEAAESIKNIEGIVNKSALDYLEGIALYMVEREL